MRKTYGTETATNILMRIFYIEKLLRHYEMDTYRRNEFFFLIYFVFRQLLRFISLNIVRRPDYKRMYLMNVMELAAYFVYSYSGPETMYEFRMFIQPKDYKSLDWTGLIVDVIMTSDLPRELLRLGTDATYYCSEERDFLQSIK